MSDDFDSVTVTAPAVVADSSRLWQTPISDLYWRVSELH
jgi:hypothetical protein